MSTSFLALTGGTRWPPRLHGDPVPRHAVAGARPPALLKHCSGVGRTADQGAAWDGQQVHHCDVQVSQLSLFRKCLKLPPYVALGSVLYLE